MKNRHVGILILGITLLFLFVVISFNQALGTIVDTTCSHGSTCPMYATLQTQKLISYSLMGLLVVIGLFITFFMKDHEKTVIREIKEVSSDNNKELTEEQKKEKLNNLDDEERKVMNIILKEEGSVYQSDVVKETGLSKVKVTRILDKIEGRGLIERKRRGMTNIIVLK